MNNPFEKILDFGDYDNILLNLDTFLSSIKDCSVKLVEENIKLKDIINEQNKKINELEKNIIILKEKYSDLDY